MSINSIIFIFLFLPVFTLIYYLFGDKYKRLILFIFCIIFYYLNAPGSVFVFLALTIINIAVGRVMDKLSDKPGARKVLFAGGVSLDALSLIFCKTAAALTGGEAPEEMALLIPIGMSFFAFKAISYLSDIYTRRITLDEDCLRDAVYLCFFPQLLSGPVSRYADMEFSGGFKRSIPLICDGTYRFMRGFCKKVLLADILSKITAEAFSADVPEMTAGYAWLGAVCQALVLYYDFSGYSDMAIGLSNIFGYGCPENFDHPYMTRSVSEFWRRWHITLGAWFRDYIYIPLGGSRNEKKYRVYLNLFAVWLITGLWHGITLNFIVWGLMYFVLISFEKLSGLPGRLRSTAAKAGYRAAVLCAVVFLWVIFRCNDTGHGLCFILRMVTPGGDAIYNDRALLLIGNYIWILAAAVILCLPVGPFMDRLSEKSRAFKIIREAVSPAAVILLFIISVSFMLSGQNNPFAYANF